MPNVKIAVYGSLRVGEYNFERMKKHVIKIIDRQVPIYGYALFDLGDYPAIVEMSSIEYVISETRGKVIVDILEVTQAGYEAINDMEVNAEYMPTTIQIGDNVVRIYIFAKSMKEMAKNYKQILSGDWLNKEVKAYKRNIYIVGRNGEAYIKWMEGKRCDEIKDADLVCFTGGEDVNPELYGEQEGYHTHFNKERDDYEITMYLQALELKKPMIGICRGLK